MSPARFLLVLTLALGALTSLPAASAQTDQVAQIQAENASLGPGCNAVALAVTTANTPTAPTQEWADEHTACSSNGVKTLAQCEGGFSGDYRVEVCAIIFNLLDGQYQMNCESLQLLSEDAITGPDPQLTVEAIQVLRDAFADSNLVATVSQFKPCTDNPVMTESYAIVALFVIPRTEGHVVLRSQVGPGIGERVAFILEDARTEME